jgi:hypothetical protein
MGKATYKPGIFKMQGGNKLCIAPDGRVYDQSGSASGAGLSPLIWDDCPRLQMLMNPTLGFCFFDDMLQIGATTAPWQNSGTNGTFTGLAGIGFGVGRLACPGTDNDECYVASNNDAAGMIVANATQNWWFEARIRINQIATAQGAFVGLGEEAGIADDFVTNDTMALKVIDYLGFQIVQATDAAPTWQTVMALNGGARVAVSATAYTAVTDWTKLGMKSVSGTVTFYVNGVALTDTVASSATNFPLDQVMEVVFGRKAGSAAVNYLDVDWVSAAQLR